MRALCLSSGLARRYQSTIKRHEALSRESNQIRGVLGRLRDWRFAPVARVPSLKYGL